MDEIEICKAALEQWGPDAQTLMVFEEMSELQKELCKAARGRTRTLLRMKSRTFTSCSAR